MCKVCEGNQTLPYEHASNKHDLDISEIATKYAILNKIGNITKAKKLGIIGQTVLELANFRDIYEVKHI